MSDCTTTTTTTRERLYNILKRTIIIILSTILSTLYINGSLGLILETDAFADEGVQEQVEQSLKNIGEILKRTATMATVSIGIGICVEKKFQHS